MTKQALSETLFEFSAHLRRLCARLELLSTEPQPRLGGLIREDLSAAIEAAKAVLEQIEANRHAVQHWKTEEKLGSIARDVDGLIGHLRGLGEGLATLDQVPESRSIGRSWLAIASDRFADEAAQFEKLGRYYGREDVHAQAADKEIAHADLEAVRHVARPEHAIVGFKAFFSDAIPSVPGGSGQMATLVPVYFATDREVDGNTQPPRIGFMNGRGAGVLTYGVAEVSIPPGHKMGRLERPTIWKFQFTEDPEKHVVVTSCELKELAAWQAAAAGRLKQTDKNAALVFIHGYNTSFDEAIRRAAQIGYDMQFDGLITAYSWGSEASLAGYFADEEAVKLTEPLLQDFLLMLRHDLGVDTIHVIAHSMGNRALVGAISAMPASAAGAPLLNEVVLAAPDIDAGLFKAAVAGLGGKAHRYTLYGSEKDAAMVMSKKLRKGFPRAGDGGKNIMVGAGVETVDASAVGKDLLGLGHIYFASKRLLLSDLFYLIRESLPAGKRHGMKPALQGVLSYWLFRP